MAGGSRDGSTLGPSPPAIHGVLETAIYVDDLDRAVEFYRRVLGFELMSDGPRLRAMAVPVPSGASGQVLLIGERGASLNMGGPLPDHDGSGPLHLAFAVPRSTIDEWAERLRDCDVPILARMEWQRGGVSLYFHDPDGHVVELASPGVWPNY